MLGPVSSSSSSVGVLGDFVAAARMAMGAARLFVKQAGACVDGMVDGDHSICVVLTCADGRHGAIAPRRILF